MSIKNVAIILVIFFGAGAARSQSALSWQFDSTAFIVQPTDQILITATVSNSANTPYFLQGGAIFGGDLQYYYQFSFLLTFNERTVPANGTLQFDFGTLSPIGGYVQPGVYVADPLSNPALINFVGIDDPANLLPSQNYFQVTVIPEPSTMQLAGVGMVFLLGLSFWKHRVFRAAQCRGER